MTEKTFFDSINVSFVDVNIDNDNGINTDQFVAAAESLVTLFDLLGSAAFTVVQKDMNGNIKKIKDYRHSHPLDTCTIQELIKSESGQKNRIATEGLLWLLRGLAFTALAIRRNLHNEEEELSISFTEAYATTLRQYHNMFIRPLFALAMKSTPTRAKFYAKLGSPTEKVSKQLEAWLTALERNVNILQQFYESGNYAKGL